MAESPITPTIPLDRPGKHHGHLRLPHSRDDSAWGSVMIPMSVIRGGEGPTALFIGGNHGDEYEGPIALHDLAISLEPEAISGRVIILPTLNQPAFLAGRRTSPVDGGNLNRSFPGRADGTVTQKIAHFVATHLIGQADIVLDFHSGGRTLDFLPFAASHVLADKAQEAACAAAAEAFGAPWTMKMLEIDNVGMLDTEAEAQGKVFVTTELRGGGTATAESAGIAKRGARNLLHHAGILPGTPTPGPGRRLEMPEDCFLFAQQEGLCEFLVDLGEPVRAGEPVARIWRANHSGKTPMICEAPRDGILAARHYPGLVQIGDCLAVVAVELG
ncbi:N(2)-acetyl-L-2,4-diaminobutanoate deacetylase DoeB [Alkalilacustris brevis]|uniref:N(2)-acetyl-L-2,4-diaminobutanoate deacetylase DoeB n=1 Tax=Alkalilacustris brevis TaxID=2026338 RepID=UPI000E0D8F74|nr:N(2)-acetyl-L-2,4-diaminobutanoate deacetylase DoeB [Alkalilacustris brevis]